jgi:hypothetical protein
VTHNEIVFHTNTIEQELLQKARKDCVLTVVCNGVDDLEQHKLWINTHFDFVRAFIYDEKLLVVKL